MTGVSTTVWPLKGEYRGHKERRLIYLCQHLLMLAAVLCKLSYVLQQKRSFCTISVYGCIFYIIATLLSR